MNSHGVNRHSHAIIDLGAVRDNYRYLKQQAGSSNRLIAVVKADAYGHGAVEISQALTKEADAFAVAAVGEAVALREAGIEHKILVMGGFVSTDELQTCIKLSLDPVLHHDFHLESLQSVADATVDVWMKLDTGMGRLGFALDRAGPILADLNQISGLGQIRLMTHLASADEADNAFTKIQLERVQTLGLDHYEWGIANSAGILGWPATQRVWARAGIALYGADPMSDRDQRARDLKPVMTMKSRILAINPHRQGDVIGYSNTYSCPRDMSIAIIATGYADGFPRHKIDAARVAIGGKLCEIVGRVSMDMITVDVTALDDIQIGDEVTLFGDFPGVNELADCSQTIAYEILCNVGAHVRREYRN